MKELKGWIEGLRWAGISDFIEQTAIECGLEVVSIHERPRVLSTTVYYTLRGHESDCALWTRVRDRTVAEYNA